MSTPSPTNILADNLLSDEEHQSLDDKTTDQWLQSWMVAKPDIQIQILIVIVANVIEKAPPKAQLRALSLDEIKRILMDERVFEIVEKGVQNKTFRNVRNLVALRTLPVPGPDVGTSTVAGDDHSGHNATMISWKSPYIGEAHEALYETMSNVCKDPTQDIYARFLAVVQSSGMGKSRMIDELSKEHFVIPINLRTRGTGFPPGDRVVSKFLIHDPFTPDDASYRAQAFLIGLFETTTDVIRTLGFSLPDIIDKMQPEDCPTDKAQMFRLFMTHGQTYSQPGRLRMKFYDDVITRAKKILTLPRNPKDKASSVAEITESEGIIPMETDDERQSGMDTVDERESGMDTDDERKKDLDTTKEKGSPVIEFNEDGKPLSLYKSALLLIKELKRESLFDLEFSPSDLESMQSDPPLIILAYDEAHGLSFPENKDKPRAPTAYSEHRRVLPTLRTLPIFALFLSTTGKIHDLTPPPEFDASDRLRELRLHLLPPFSALGFDQMVKAYASKTDGQNFGINDVSKIETMVLFGRPLWGSRYKHGNALNKSDIGGFALQKLMHGDLKNPSSSAKLALMSVRLALEFNAQTTEGRAREMEQVEKYMRVCILVHKGFETAVTISPSEPLLADAARRHMSAPSSTFNMPASLIEHLTTMGLDKGDRGELAAQVILILAADQAYVEHLKRSSVKGNPRAFSVELFIKALLTNKHNDNKHNDVLRSLPAKWRTKTESTRDFQTAFANTRIYFTHFIKLDHPGVVNRDFMWRLAIRGCVGLCANGQNGIDIIAPLVFGTGTLCRSNVSALFVQVKNDKSYKAQPNTILFDLMNPYLVRFFDIKEETPLPIIRMVFALGSPTSAVEVIPQYEERHPRKAKTKAQNAVKKSPRYTSYDIWCAKASSDTFAVINKGDEQNYALLLKSEKVFPQAYRSESRIEAIEPIRRSMNPGTSVEGAHWESFCDVNTPHLPTVDLADVIDFAEEVEE